MDVLLKDLSATMINATGHVVLEMTCACIFNKAKQYYKACIHEPMRLRKSISVKFSGEDGVDLGAMKNDFFDVVLTNLRNELFEGNDTRLLPRSHWGSESELLIAGTIVAHSLLLGGPAFPYLHPAMYASWHSIV